MITSCDVVKWGSDPMSTSHDHDKENNNREHQAGFQSLLKHICCFCFCCVFLHWRMWEYFCEKLCNCINEFHYFCLAAIQNPFQNILPCSRAFIRILFLVFSCIYKVFSADIQLIHEKKDSNPIKQARGRKCMQKWHLCMSDLSGLLLNSGFTLSIMLLYHNPKFLEITMFR